MDFLTGSWRWSVNVTADVTTEPEDGFDVRFGAADGGEQRRALAHAAEVAFEDVTAVRLFPAFRGQRNNTAWGWCATNTPRSSRSPASRFPATGPWPSPATALTALPRGRPRT
jgi:hypothetical protein